MKMVIEPQFHKISTQIETIPDIFETSGEIIYEARNKLKKINIDGVDFVVKSFRCPHFLNRLAYTFFRKSKAHRSYEYAVELLSRGIPTPEPVTYIEIKSGGLLGKSYFINRFADGFSHIREQMYGRNISNVFIEDFVAFVSMMHSKGVFHKDLSPGNILFRQLGTSFEFCVLDINRMKFYPEISFIQRCKNFERLTANQVVLSSIANSYAKQNNFDAEQTLNLMKQHSRKFFKGRKNI